MLKRPRSSLPTTRRMRASRFSARSSGGMSRVPMAAWNVRLSRLRTRTVFRNELMRFVGSAVGGTGRGILPRGPRTTPRRFPITGMRGASAMKKSYDVARALAFRLSLAYSYLLRLDHEVRDVPRLERKLTGSEDADADRLPPSFRQDRKSTRLNSSHSQISYAVFCLKKKKQLSARVHSQSEPRAHDAATRARI